MPEQSTASARLKSAALPALGPVIFQDDFSHGLQQWMLDIDDDARGNTRSPQVNVVRHAEDALPALRLTLPGTVGAFRTEVSLPAEKNLNERWYAECTQFPRGSDASGFIFMQWHALIGEQNKRQAATLGLRNFPNLAIHLQGETFSVSRAWGSLSKPERDHRAIEVAVDHHAWQAWVVHVLWSDQEQGLVRIWLNQQLVYEAHGANVYPQAQRVTPYFKTGIYRPSRKPKNNPSAQEADTVMYVRYVKLGAHSADEALMRPACQPSAASTISTQ